MKISTLLDKIRILLGANERSEMKEKMNICDSFGGESNLVRFDWA